MFSKRMFEPSVLLLIVALALALRTIGLGLTFRSADETAVAARILKYPGYAWMFREYYGLLINLIIKFWAAGVSALGISLTEIIWKMPMALIGTLQVPVIWGFLRSWNAGRFGRLFGAALVAVLPLHVMQSRYLWGYEVLGFFFLILFLWSGRLFFQQPTRRRGGLLSLAAGFYLISHGYILPFLPTLIVAIGLWTPRDHAPAIQRFWSSIRLLFRRGVWIFPVLVLPFCLYPVAHALRKPSRPGFFLLDHFPSFIGNLGLGVMLLLVLAAAGYLSLRGDRRRDVLLLAASGAFYLAPLFFGTPPGITAVRGYMLIGSCLWLVGAVLVADSWAGRRPKAAVVLAILCVVTTIWGTAESIFGRDRLFDPALVKIERGGLSADPGSKAAGYLLRRHLDPEARVLAIHRNIEPLNLYYYFGRDGTAYYDLSLDETREKFEAEKTRMDVVICDPEQVPFVAGSGEYALRIILISEGDPQLWVFARPHVSLPELTADVVDLNRAYDQKYAPKVRIR